MVEPTTVRSIDTYSLKLFLETIKNGGDYIWLKTQALILLDRKLDAFTALNQAKLTFNESWSAENQKVYEQLQEENYLEFEIFFINSCC